MFQIHNYLVILQIEILRAKVRFFHLMKRHSPQKIVNNL